MDANMRQIATHCYVGVNQDGVREFVVVDKQDRSTAKAVAKAIREGLMIHRETIEDFRMLPFGDEPAKNRR